MNSSLRSGHGRPSARCRSGTSVAGGLRSRPLRLAVSVAAEQRSTSAPDSAAPASDAVTGRRRALAGVLSAAALALGLDAGASKAKVAVASVEKGGEGERDVQTTASGIKMSLVSSGRGDPPASGAVVLVDVVGTLADGTVFLDTRKEGAAPLAFQMGTTNIFVTEGLAQVVETMRSGDVKLAVVPPSLGYGSRGVSFKSGRRVPPNSPLFYEITLLRCQTFALGMACCADADYPCVKKPAAEPAPSRDELQAVGWRAALTTEASRCQGGVQWEDGRGGCTA